MIVPKYWAEAKATRRVQNHQITLRRYGWSDESEARAKEHAESRLRDALAEAEAGKKIRKREPKVAYNGAEGVPIREEIVARFEPSVVTRNSYGSLCVNTPDVLFADIDLEREPGCRFYFAVFALLLAFAATLAILTQSWEMFGVAFVGALILLAPITRLAHKTAGLLLGNSECRAKKRIADFARDNPDRHLRVYSTPGGFRVLVMDRTFDPKSEETARLFRALSVDPLYARMCRNQNCFRARVSPKPWRIGIRDSMKPRPGVWPINPERMPERLEWIRRYESKSKEFASCRFEERLGGADVDSKAEIVRSIHDQYSKSDTDLPLA